MSKEEEIFDKEYIQKKFDSSEYGVIELLIAKALYKYLFLDEKTITEAVNIKLNVRLQKPHYKRNIKAMLGKIVHKYNYVENKSNGYEKIEHVVYYLTKAAYDFIKTKYSKMPITYRIKEKSPKRDLLNSYDINYIMERLALNRWHLFLLTTYNKTLVQEVYCTRWHYLSSRIKVPSCIRIKTSAGKINMVGLVYPRKPSDNSVERLIKKIEEVSMQSIKIIKANVLIVIICASVNEIEAAHKTISKKGNKLSEGLLYVTDADIVNGKAMRRMYAVHNEKGMTKKTFYSFTK